MNLENIALQAEILSPAFIAGLLVLSTHIPMGQEILKRGIIFLDLSIAQVAAFGLILSGSLGLELHSHYFGELASRVVAVLAAVTGASALYLFRKKEARIQEALIGILFVLSATGSLLLLTKDPHTGERLKEILVGQILWIDQTDLFTTATAYAIVLFLWFRFRHLMDGYGFYVLFAVTITLSTQLVGVYLVFASLVVPALVSLKRTHPFLVAYAVGLLGYISGLVASSIFDFPSGAMIAWCLVAVAVFFYLTDRIKLKLANKNSLE